jgi:ABC-type Fe3+-siderophore transport system permease subunit
MKPTHAFIVALAAVLLGLFLPGWIGAALLLAIVGVLLAVLAANRGSLRPGTTAVRFLIIAGVAVVAVLKAIWQ